MEALICILLEALAPLIAVLLEGFLWLAICVSSTLLSLVVQLVAALLRWRRDAALSPRSAPAAPAAAGPPRAPARNPAPARRWLRRLMIGCAGLSTLAFATVLIVNTWFLDDIVRALLARQQVRSGIAITAQEVTGNLFTGHFLASGISVQRHDHPAGTIDLTVRTVEVSIAVWRLIASSPVLETLAVDGVSGRYERGVPGQGPRKAAAAGNGTSGGAEDDGAMPAGTDGAQVKHPFHIEALTVSNLVVAYADHTRKRPFAVPVTLTRLTAKPLRSDWAVFDVLFRANATGTIAGRPLTITTSGDDLGRETRWDVDGLPVELLAAQIGGPFVLLTAGTADVHVSDHWRREQGRREIVMDWSVVLHEVHAEVPESTSRMMALLAKPAVAFINAKGTRVPLWFRMEIAEDRFHGAASAEAAGLWRVVADAAAATLAKELGIETRDVEGAAKTVREMAAEALDHWRKRKP